MSGAVANIGGFDGLLGMKAYTVTPNGYRFFVNLFEVSGGEESVRAAIADRHRPSDLPRDFQQDVEEWLGTALKSPA